FLVALNLIVSGTVLERVTRNRIEVVRLAYLALPGPRRRSASEHAVAGVAVGSGDGTRPMQRTP
ncbi:MAG TPA: hypothetical protein VFK66_08170, partial [Oryzihumus sp.]|nr:hypothetical protein [Oryzihumus sp.]